MPFFHNRCDTFFCRGICSSVSLHRSRKYRSPRLSGVRNIRISVYGAIGMLPVRSFFCGRPLLPVRYAPAAIKAFLTALVQSAQYLLGEFFGKILGKPDIHIFK